MNVFYRMSVNVFFPIFLSVCTLILFQNEFVNAAEKQGNSGSDSKQPADLNFTIIKGDYEYEIEDRADPFVPFFTGEAATEEIDTDEILEPSSRLSGMQLFEPGQLNLVALMKLKGVYIAMVEDFKGQGYVITEGTKIGKRGTVKQILDNKVLIEEIAVTRAGKELKSEIVMALRKEGEE